MNSLFEAKYDELFTEFNYYVAEHPEFSERIPHDALVILLDKNDPAFNRENLRRVRNYLQEDDVSGRAVVYIQVGRLAPVRSRVRNLRMLTREPRYASVITPCIKLRRTLNPLPFLRGKSIRCPGCRPPADPYKGDDRSSSAGPPGVGNPYVAPTDLSACGDTPTKSIRRSGGHLPGTWLRVSAETSAPALCIAGGGFQLLLGVARPRHRRLKTRRLATETCCRRLGAGCFRTGMRPGAPNPAGTETWRLRRGDGPPRTNSSARRHRRGKSICRPGCRPPADPSRGDGRSSSAGPPGVSNPYVAPTDLSACGDTQT